jgi:peptidoglycan hydrolase CwlO-like protein|tara:strand:+ start:70 stop:285 length:216 start_codon:yes stop_codon:yes gene_type:complete
MTVEKKEKTVDIELTPQQKNIQAHIQSLTTKINKLQFEIDELMPSLNMYQQALADSMKEQVKEEEKKDDNS